MKERKQATNCTLVNNPHEKSALAMGLLKRCVPETVTSKQKRFGKSKGMHDRLYLVQQSMTQKTLK